MKSRKGKISVREHIEKHSEFSEIMWQSAVKATNKCFGKENLKQEKWILQNATQRTALYCKYMFFFVFTSTSSKTASC